MLSDDIIFKELEKIIEKKKERYAKALKIEESRGEIFTRVTDLENSLVDAYTKLLKLKYYVRQNRIDTTEIEDDAESFVEVFGDVEEEG